MHIIIHNACSYLPVLVSMFPFSALFQINEMNGDISVLGSLDSEISLQVNLTVEARDGGNPSLVQDVSTEFVLLLINIIATITKILILF